MFIALKWDHLLAKHFIGWIVVECSKVGEKFGLPQALPPRRDIAYFVCPEHAEADAKAFASIKNNAGNYDTRKEYSVYLSDHHGYTHYSWDHNYLQELVRHAVLYWEDGQYQSHEPIRDDVAYFVHPEFSEQDSSLFSRYKVGALSVDYQMEYSRH